MVKEYLLGKKLRPFTVMLCLVNVQSNYAE